MIIGAGGVGTVVAFKCAEVKEVFSEIMLASRTKSKCDIIAADVAKKYPERTKIQTAKVDADNVPELVDLIHSFHPVMLFFLLLPVSIFPILCKAREKSL